MTPRSQVPAIGATKLFRSRSEFRSHFLRALKIPWIASSRPGNSLAHIGIAVRSAILIVTAIVSGCSGGSGAIIDTVRSVYQQGGDIPSALNPNFRYLRVTRSGRVALLALGDIEKHSEGPIEVWYSAEREVLRTQNGRLVGATGLTTEWREVILPPLPTWSTLANSKEPFRWIRTRDLMPGYRYGLKDALSLRVIEPRTRSALRGIDSQSLTWFEERVESEQIAWYSTVLGDSPAADLALPPARYAVDFRDGVETVVYGEQCLTNELCITWQRWAAAPKNPTGRK